MGKFLSISIGAIFTFLGIALLFRWWYEFLLVAKVTLPFLFILGGIIAIFAGISELKDTIKSKNK